MWSQTTLNATWTKQQFMDALVSVLTNASVGFVLYDDEAASFKKTLRLNLGAGKDLCYKFILTDITNGCRIQSYFFETADYSLTTHAIPANNNDQGTIDFLFANPVITNLASSPDKSVIGFWFKFSSTITHPILFTLIDPFTTAPGTLLNTGDDGSGYPLWASFNRASGSVLLNTVGPAQIAGFQSGIFSPGGGGFSMNVLSVKTTRAPLSPSYWVEGWGGCTQSNNSVVDVRYPRRRVDAWAGTGVLVEGARAYIVTATSSANGLTPIIDIRGWLGLADSLLVADNFTGGLEDTFTVAGKTYRIVYNYNQGATPVYNVYSASLAIRVS